MTHGLERCSDQSSSIGRACRARSRLPPVLQQVVAVLAAGLATQLLLTFRGDSPAHVVGGAALVMFLGALAPRTLLRRHPATTELAIFATVLAAAWMGEKSIIGPFQLDDVAFTIGGAFVALPFVPNGSTARRERVHLAAAAVLLATAALVHRYVLQLGSA